MQEVEEDKYTLVRNEPNMHKKDVTFFGSTPKLMSYYYYCIIAVFVCNTACRMD